VAYNFAPWTGATTCSGAAQPGAKAMLKWLLENVDKSKNLGIYNCRNVRGGSTTSTHGEGRGIDLGMPMSKGKGSNAGTAVVKLLAENGKKLGIQCIIYNRKIYSAKSPSGRPYHGVNPHYDHLHIELTRDAGKRLTYATLDAVLGKKESKPAPKPIPKPIQELGEKIARLPESDKRSLNVGDRGEDVALVQRFLGVQDTGYYGSQTKAAVLRYKRMHGLTYDSVWGRACWQLLESVVKNA
jgi:hypothetical protein